MFKSMLENFILLIDLIIKVILGVLGILFNFFVMIFVIDIIISIYQSGTNLKNLFIVLLLYTGVNFLLGSFLSIYGRKKANLGNI